MKSNFSQQHFSEQPERQEIEQSNRRAVLSEAGDRALRISLDTTLQAQWHQPGVRVYYAATKGGVTCRHRPTCSGQHLSSGSSDYFKPATKEN